MTDPTERPGPYEAWRADVDAEVHRLWHRAGTLAPFDNPASTSVDDAFGTFVGTVVGTVVALFVVLTLAACTAGVVWLWTLVI